MPHDLPDDTRGIIDPVAMMRHVDFHRFPAGEILNGLVEWFWTAAWELPDGSYLDQRVLGHPAGNISIGTIDDDGPLDPADGRVFGVATEASHLRLIGAGWTVAARTSVGGLGLLLGVPARDTTDRMLPLAGTIPGVDGAQLLADVLAESTNQARSAVLRSALEAAVTLRDPADVDQAREVASVAKIAEEDRTVVRTSQLATIAGCSTRTLQRLFEFHVGVSPAWVIRRWRIIEAADAARAAFAQGEEWRGWAAVAAELGYAAQAHLTRDFQAHLGTTPSAYIIQVAS